MIDELIQQATNLEHCLEKGTSADFPSAYPDKSHFARYTELKNKFSEYPIEMGALVAEVEQWIAETEKKMVKAYKIKKCANQQASISAAFSSNPIIFLNRHDGKHTQKVQERALELLKCFDVCNLNFYELFFLLCAIVVHDIGNIVGRKGHEQEIRHILDSQCVDILPDSVERRIIARIARAHGGRVGNNEDTISLLQEEVPINKFIVRERLLAAILRFSDELADDSSRANYAAMNSGIIKGASLIYHVYSSSLHTVDIRKNPINGTYEIILAYEFDTDTACTVYNIAGKKQYLIDEIYSRTIKMDRERRYCIRYLRPYIPLERIKVNITITNSKDEFDYYPITYTLEENGYPTDIFATIKDVDIEIKSGEELANELVERGLCDAKA